MQTAETRPPTTRKDAVRNRALLVAAARDVFREQGVEARLDEVARRAGVGAGTLYRHFPTREALVEAILAERIDEFAALAGSALDHEDAWEGLVGLLEAILELQRGDRVLKEVFVRYPPDESNLSASRQQIRVLFGQVLARAHEQGVLREDYTLPDMAMLLWSFAPVIDATESAAPEVWRRHLHWTLDGLRPAAATPQSQPPLDDDQLHDAMRCLRRQRLHQKR
jgi:AcrR family transcriptional regulator